MEITREVFDSLDAFELRLYIHYKLQGTPQVKESLRETAKGAKLSVNKVMDARKTLEKKGFIENRPRIIQESGVLVK